MLVSSTAAKTSKGHHNSTENLIIYQTDGLQFDEYLNLSGSSIFPASELTWHIYEVLPEVEFSQNIINQSIQNSINEQNIYWPDNIKNYLNKYNYDYLDNSPKYKKKWQNKLYNRGFEQTDINKILFSINFDLHKRS